MINLRCFIRTVASIACAGLFLGFHGEYANAGTSGSVMWPKGSSVVLVYHPYYPGGLGEYISVQWPIANGADHYRLKVVFKSGGVSNVYTSTLEASRTSWIFRGAGGTYRATVTAYSGPDEAIAYSETIQGRMTVR